MERKGNMHGRLSRCPVLLRRASGQPFEVLAEEAGVREIELVGYLRHISAAVAKHHLGLCNERPVYPFLGRNAAGLANHRAQIAYRNAHFAGIEVEVMLPAAIVVNKIDEPLEENPLVCIAADRRRRGVGKQRVEEVQIGRNEVQDYLIVVAGLVRDIEKQV